MPFQIKMIDGGVELLCPGSTGTPPGVDSARGWQYSSARSNVVVDWLVAVLRRKQLLNLSKSGGVELPGAPGVDCGLMSPLL